ncbi:MAG: prepilin-type N-terminal cleavage/methylation domain-containing protein, partial [Candidatus Eremiobacteraeota bacterium]|nr:prepilin-type N-terminal cleavage/methylation domain-containing protein [Candidatus Eremiobacteraeota bacterium]
MGDRLLFKRSFVSRSNRSGFTIVEVLTVVSVFGILVTAIFMIFNLGLSAFHKTTVKNELLQQAQITNVKLTADLERSSLGSLSSDWADPTRGIAAFLSPLDDNAEFKTDTRGRPIWQKYIVYYLDDGTNEIFREEIPLVAGAPQRSVPTPIEFYNGGTGPKPLLAYRNGGR